MGVHVQTIAHILYLVTHCSIFDFNIRVYLTVISGMIVSSQNAFAALKQL
jgi:hypothetical protein